MVPPGGPPISSDRWGVLLLAHGAPDRLEDIPEFLLHVRGGRKLPEAAIEEIKRRYALVGGGSPLLKLTNQQAEALAKAIGRPVYVGMRNWKPFIAEAIRRASEDGVERLVALCLAPQNSRTSVGLYRKHLQDAVEKTASQIGIEFIESWHDHPELIAAFREKISRALEVAPKDGGENVPVVFTAHSVPSRTIQEGDPYERQVQETAELLAGAMPLTNWCVAFQSQGMTEEPWIGPTVESQIDRLAAAGHQRLLIAPIGFVSDHLETLYDIDVALREYGKTRAVNIMRSESLNDASLFIRALASIVLSRVRGEAERQHA